MTHQDQPEDTSSTDQVLNLESLPKELPTIEFACNKITIKQFVENNASLFKKNKLNCEVFVTNSGEIKYIISILNKKDISPIKLNKTELFYFIKIFGKSDYRRSLKINIDKLSYDNLSTKQDCLELTSSKLANVKKIPLILVEKLTADKKGRICLGKYFKIKLTSIPNEECEYSLEYDWYYGLSRYDFYQQFRFGSKPVNYETKKLTDFETKDFMTTLCSKNSITFDSHDNEFQSILLKKDEVAIDKDRLDFLKKFFVCAMIVLFIFATCTFVSDIYGKIYPNETVLGKTTKERFLEKTMLEKFEEFEKIIAYKDNLILQANDEKVKFEARTRQYLVNINFSDELQIDIAEHDVAAIVMCVVVLSIAIPLFIHDICCNQSNSNTKSKANEKTQDLKAEKNLAKPAQKNNHIDKPKIKMQKTSKANIRQNKQSPTVSSDQFGTKTRRKFV